MPGTNNFIQWNPTAANQETDAQYVADTLRSAGATNPSILPSATANKVLYQATTFIAALAQALANKNYNVSDASLSTLAGVLANVITTADLTAYAPLASPTFTGTPAAPTPSTADNTTKLATTAFVKAQAYAPIASPGLTGSPTAPTPATADSSSLLATTAFVKNQAYQPSLGFTPVQQGGGVSQGANKVYLGWDGASLRLQVDASDKGDLLLASSIPGANGTNGWVKLPTGLILQWGYGTVPGTGSTYTFLFTFPNAVFQILCSDQGGSGSSGVHTCSASPISTSQFNAWALDYNGNTVSTNFGWLAIGY
jgi:hypothetical protein